ncbi:MAG: hypothetical protein ABSC25_13400 [Roseiarcus sp.]|jgi:hypothetical protein
MSADTDSGVGSDWRACGVASIGGAVVVGAQVIFFEFRSRAANCRATFLLIGGGLGIGGDLGGATAPDPSSIVHNQNPDLWTNLKCDKPFSANDLDLAYAAMSGITVSGAYGYSLQGVSAGLVTSLFTDQDVSGWCVGVGASATMMVGVWKQLGTSSAHY